jgi:hypothetical protein
VSGEGNNNHGIEPGTPNGNVIDLQGRYQAEKLLDALLHADRHDAAHDRLLAEALSAGTLVLAAAVRRLDSSRPYQLAALANLIAAFPSRQGAIKSLVRAAADRRNSDNRRMGAMIVLNQYLGVPPGEDFITSLRNPAQAAISSLIGSLNEYADHSEMLHEYFRSLLQQPVEVLHSVLSTLADVPGDGATAALRLLALQRDPDLMHAAIEALASRDVPEAVSALVALVPNLPRDMARSVSRHLHKLQLSGHRLASPAAIDRRCRAILSAIDGHGKRMLWFQVPSMKPGETAIVGLLTRDGMGLVDALGAVSFGGLAFPAPAPLGTVHPPFAPEVPDSPPNVALMACLEVPYVYGLHILRDAISKNWETGTQLPVEYQLFFDTLWRFGWGKAAEAAATGASTWPGSASVDYTDDEHELLDNPVFADWYLESGAVYLAAQEILALDAQLPSNMAGESWRAALPTLIKLARTDFNAGLRQCYSERLELMTHWLYLAGQERAARLAASAARSITASPPEANPFVLALAQKGILVALENISHATGVEI